LDVVAGVGKDVDITVERKSIAADAVRGYAVGRCKSRARRAKGSGSGLVRLNSERARRCSDPQFATSTGPREW
jgi:hypothetical protein